MNRDVPTTGIRPLFEPLLEHVADARWPRVTIVRRAGTARRRTHTAVGAVAAVGALVLGGAAVTDAQGVMPSLENARSAGVAALRLGPGSGVRGPPSRPSRRARPTYLPCPSPTTTSSPSTSSPSACRGGGDRPAPAARAPAS